MGNPRSASNAWAKIRGKLQMSSDSAPAKATPKKKAGAAKKEDGEEGTDTPKKTPRKRAAKKETVDGENASPKKKGRPVAKGKKASDDESGESTLTLDTHQLYADILQPTARSRSRLKSSLMTATPRSTVTLLPPMSRSKMRTLECALALHLARSVRCHFRSSNNTDSH
jgi:hypothetical protein